MTDLQMSDGTLLSLLQWCDTLFPSGAFAHSFGLESAVQSGKVVNGAGLSDWIRARMDHQLFSCDAVLLCNTYRAGECNDLDRIRRLDGIGNAMRIPHEVRAGGRMIATRMIQTAAELYPTPWTTACGRLLSTGQMKGDPAVAFGIAGIGAGIPLQPTLLGYLYMFISGQISAALRLLPIGQQEGQRIIHALLDWAVQSGRAGGVIADPAIRLATFMPALEIGAMRHEISDVRLFQS